MIVIGITGGIGSGKSHVCQEFAKRGIVVYDSDSIAKMLLDTVYALRTEICAKYGKEMYIDGKYNRVHVRNLILEDPSVLSGLGKLVDPYLSSDLKLRKSQFNDHKFMVVESALLFKSKMIESVDFKIDVQAPDDVRMERIHKRDPQRSDAEIMLMMKQQEDDYLVDCIFINDGINDVEKFVTDIIESM